MAAQISDSPLNVPAFHVAIHHMLIYFHQPQTTPTEDHFKKDACFYSLISLDDGEAGEADRQVPASSRRNQDDWESGQNPENTLTPTAYHDGKVRSAELGAARTPSAVPSIPRCAFNPRRGGYSCLWRRRLGGGGNGGGGGGGGGRCGYGSATR